MLYLMGRQVTNVLVLCTENSCRSIIADGTNSQA
jgi:protein-tyrosine-phosphatase